MYIQKEMLSTIKVISPVIHIPVYLEERVEFLLESEKSNFGMYYKRICSLSSVVCLSQNLNISDVMNIENRDTKISNETEPEVDFH